MVYFDNKKDPQEVWIPRNDGNGYVHTGSSQSYEEGYADGVNDQKAKLASTAFTENGDYQRNDGWSAITVNVPQSGSSVLEGKEITVSQDVTIVVPTSGYDGFSAVTVDATEYGQENYDSGFDDGYTDGYSSGSSEGYDSGYTEGYQSGSTDGFNSGYTSGSTDGYESGYTEGYNSGYTSGETDGYNSGYTSGETDGFNSGYTSGETHQKSLLGTTAFTINGSYSAENGYSAITVNVPQTGSTAVLGVGSFSANGTYSASTDNLDGYSAITVNVPTSGEREIIMVTTGWCWFDTDYTMHYGDSIEIEHCTFGKSGIVQGRHQQYVGGNQSELFRIGENEYYLYLEYFKNFSSADRLMPLPPSGSLIEDKTINFSSTGFVIDGNVITSYTTTEKASTAHLVFFADTVSGNYSITGQTAKMGVVRIYGSDGTLKATFKPMLDELNVPFFKYVEEDIDIYAIGSGTPSYEIIDPSYVSGYTDGYTSGYTEGYNSGYTSGENDVISTFSSITITQNGHYGSYAHPMTSITINVPTSGGSGYSIDQLAIRDYNINNPTVSTTDIKLFAFANSNLSGMLTIGSAVTNIYAYAFSYTNISGITFPQTIVGNEYGKMVMAGSGQFEGCANLTSVNVPSYIEFTDNARARNTYGIFEECRNLVNVNWDADRVPTYCFRYCSSLSAINLTNVTNIDNYSFMNCGSLSSITIPSVCTRIGNGAFGNCSSLNEINVLATTAPTLGVVAFTNTPTGTVHYPQGSDYSSWQSNTDLSGWTFVGDL